MGQSPSTPITRSYRTKLAWGLLIALGFFIALESVLVVFGFQPTVHHRDPFVGFESGLPLFVPETIEGQAVLQTANNKLQYFNPQQFPQEKSPRTTRIFCLGGSTTFGRPYDDRTSFVGWLREFLPRVDSRRNWDVINAGGISYASYRVAALMDELTQYAPDLFIIYTGHNEFLEERTYRDLKWTPSPLRWSAAALFRTRTYSLVDQLVSSQAMKSDTRAMLSSEVDTILDHASGPTSYHRDDQLRRQIFAHFQFNLQRMIDTARRSGAAVVLVTPAANIKDFSPFKSEHWKELVPQQEERWFEHFAAAKERLSDHDAQQSLARLREAARLDDGRADLHYLMATSYFALQRFDDAEAAFRLAIDRDICPLRAPTEILQLVEQAAMKNQVPLVDFAHILQDVCQATHGHPLPGREYFLDHVHPTVEGHRLLALALLEAMNLSGMLSPENQSLDDQMIGEVSARVEASINVERHARALTNLAQVLSWAGKQAEAAPLAKQAVQLRTRWNLDPDPECLFYAAVGLAVEGSDTDAVELFEQVVALEPRNSQARWRLAALYYDQLRYQDALVHFREAVELEPHDTYCQQMLGTVLMKLDRPDEALNVFYQAAKLEPEDESIQDNIRFVLQTLERG